MLGNGPASWRHRLVTGGTPGVECCLRLSQGRVLGTIAAVIQCEQVCALRDMTLGGKCPASGGREGGLTGLGGSSCGVKMVGWHGVRTRREKLDGAGVRAEGVAQAPSSVTPQRGLAG